MWGAPGILGDVKVVPGKHASFTLPTMDNAKFRISCIAQKHQSSSIAAALAQSATPAPFAPLAAHPTAQQTPIGTASQQLPPPPPGPPPTAAAPAAPLPPAAAPGYQAPAAPPSFTPLTGGGLPVVPPPPAPATSSTPAAAPSPYSPAPPPPSRVN